MTFKINLTILYLLSIALLTSTLFYSCKIEQVKAASGHIANESKQVIRVNYADDPDGVKIYEYDGDGNISMMVQARDTTIYTYMPTTIIKKYSNVKAHWDAETIYNLDPTGKVIASQIKDEKGAIISNFKFNYNKEGYLVKSYREVLASKSTTSVEFEYQDGNMILMREVNGDGKIISKFVCEYYADKVMDQNIFLQAFTEEILSNDRFGKKNKNFVKSSCNISSEGDTLSNLNYTYEDVNNEKILKMVEHDVYNEFKMPITYHFK